MGTRPSHPPSDARTWWHETLEQHHVELEQKIQQYLTDAVTTPQGCLELGSEECPARVQWRGQRIRVYQLIAWARANEAPHPRSVVRHLCNNRACINPDHLAIGTQAQNLFDQRQKRAQDIANYWSHE